MVGAGTRLLKALVWLAAGGGIAATVFARPAFAHDGAVPHDPAGAALAGLLVVVAAWWLVGIARSRRRPLSQLAAFALGWLVLVLALFGPLDALAQRSLAGHMVQHMLLIAVVPPLLVAGAPVAAMLRALPARARIAPAALYAAIERALVSRPLTAALVHGATLWLWHLPGPYQAAAASPALHHLEHATLLLGAVWFWATLLAPARRGAGAFGGAVIAALLTVMHTGMLGALLTFAPQPLYPDHPSTLAALSPVEDQQLAGLIMWVPGGIAYTVAIVALGLAWLGALPSGRSARPAP
jgi:putative membrane protein